MTYMVASAAPALPRTCARLDGVAKLTFSTLSAAREAARCRRPRKHIYLCSACGCWHLASVRA